MSVVFFYGVQRWVSARHNRGGVLNRKAVQMTPTRRRRCDGRLKPRPLCLCLLKTRKKTPTPVVSSSPDTCFLIAIHTHLHTSHRLSRNSLTSHMLHRCRKNPSFPANNPPVQTVAAVPTWNLSLVTLLLYVITFTTEQIACLLPFTSSFRAPLIHLQ